MRFLLPSSRPADRGVTDLQIEEAKKLAAECEEIKEQLVAQANGALVRLRHGGQKDVEGESKS